MPLPYSGAIYHAHAGAASANSGTAGAVSWAVERRLRVHPAVDDAGTKLDRVAGHDDQGLALGEVEAGIKLAILLVTVGGPKSGETLLTVELGEHVRDVSHHMVMTLGRQLRDLAAGHGQGGVGVEGNDPVHLKCPAKAPSPNCSVPYKLQSPQEDTE